MFRLISDKMISQTKIFHLFNNRISSKSEMFHLFNNRSNKDKVIILSFKYKVIIFSFKFIYRTDRKLQINIKLPFWTEKKQK